MKLFDEMPRLEGDRIVLREMTASDAPALATLAESELVNRYLPTTLYEQRYDDKALAIARMREECFVTKQSILLATCMRSSPDQMLGIAEIYNYIPEERKASIGGRLLEAHWNKGIAKEIVRLLSSYIFSCEDIETITSHVMVENTFSAKAMLASGFVKTRAGVYEDWGRGAPVLVDKFVLEKPVQ